MAEASTATQAACPRDVIGAGDRPDARYRNRELTWIEFDERVLELAADTTMPVLERAKFLAITADNLDEFFQVRVAGLHEQVEANPAVVTSDGRTPGETLDEIRERLDVLYARLDVVAADVVGDLAEHGIRISGWLSLDGDERDWLAKMFRERVFPVLTPLAVDPSHPFPYISNLSLNLAVELRDPETHERRFARVKVPPNVPRFVALPDGEQFVPLEQVIAAHLDVLFPGMRIVSHYPFRVTRNADLVVEEEEADDLLVAIESQLTHRGRGRVVRLEVEPYIAETTRQLLIEELGITEREVYVTRGPLDLSGLWAVAGMSRPDLKDEPWTPTTPPRLDGTSVFRAMREGDLLLHHPYDSFDASVGAFIEQAARDPKVLAIKQTLYRTSGPGSPIVRALIQAAEDGKQVVALVELKARFDEEANIEWARELEQRGVHVVYGVVGLKTHTKIALVVRDEDGRTRRYCHVGTGNYNDKTARIYEDLGLLTCDEAIGQDLTDLFNHLTGYSRQGPFHKLLVAPTSLRPRILELIERETEAPDGRIVMKMNSLVDAEVVDALYRASAAGTPVDLVVRGICCLRAGVPGLSDNIRVRSIVGRYLEHSRIYRFGSEARGITHLIGSADLMPRNLDRRVEAVVPVTDPALQQRLEEILRINLEDDALAWTLQPDGRWRRAPQRTATTNTHVALARAALQRQRREGR